MHCVQALSQVLHVGHQEPVWCCDHVEVMDETCFFWFFKTPLLSVDVVLDTMCWHWCSANTLPPHLLQQCVRGSGGRGAIDLFYTCLAGPADDFESSSCLNGWKVTPNSCCLHGLCCWVTGTCCCRGTSEWGLLQVPWTLHPNCQCRYILFE